MSLRSFIATLILAGIVPAVASSQTDAEQPPRLYLELNALQDVGGACRLTFLARNETGSEIEKAVFETVIFDASGGVVSLSLFDFRGLPPDRPRVRQFDLPGMACASVGQALINGANTCVVDGIESELCQNALSLGSRLEVELLG